MQTLYSTLISNSHLDLNSGILLKCTIISIAHMNQLERKAAAALKRRKNSVNNIYLKDYGKKKMGAGTKETLPNGVLQKNLIRVGKGVKKDPLIFDGYCAIIAYAISHMMNRAHEKSRHSDPKLMSYVTNLQNTRNSKKQYNAALFILNYASNLLQDAGMSLLSAPFSLDDFKVLNDKHHTQLFCFDSVFSGSLTYLYPPIIDPTRMRIYLYQNSEISQSQLWHVDVLKVPPKIFQKNYLVCCFTIQRSPRYHKCQKYRICFFCRAPIIQKKHYFSDIYEGFCTKEKFPGSGKYFCSGCEKYTSQEECLKRHQLYCADGQKCGNCTATITAPYPKRKRKLSFDNQPPETPLQKKLKNHQCNQSFCAVCFSHYPSSDHHICKHATVAYTKGLL